MLEEEMLKTLDEVEDMKRKLIAQDKEMGQMKAEQQKVSDNLSALEEQQSRLKKEIEDRQGKVNSSLSTKKLALKPDMSGKVNEGVEVSDPSGSAEEVIEQSVQPDWKENMKQNINSNPYFSSAPLHVSSLVGVPMYQHSTQNYGYQPVLPSSPYFCKCMCVCLRLLLPSPKCKMLKEIIF
jgi:small-conductance mechanosensitive channel